MANVLTALVPKIIASAMGTLPGQAAMVKRVSHDLSALTGQKGQTIDVPVPAAKVVNDVVHGANQVQGQDSTRVTKPVALDQWKESPIYMSDKEMEEIDSSTHLQSEVAECLKALRTNINSYLFSQYKGVYNTSGVAGTTPFAANDSVVRESRKNILAAGGNSPTPDTHSVVLDLDAEVNALGLATYADFEKSADAGPKLDGIVGVKRGFSFLSDADVPTHTAGTLTGAPSANGAQSTGINQVSVATGAGEAVELLEGDVITFAGSDQEYAVGADVSIGASTNGLVAITPALVDALAGGEAVSVASDHVVNLAFRLDAFAFANRQLVTSSNLMAGGPVFFQAIPDPVTGVIYRLEITRQHKQWKWSFDVLYGGALIRPELATRILG